LAVNANIGDHDNARDIPSSRLCCDTSELAAAPTAQWGELLMWDVLTSTGQRVTGIAHESDARRSIQSMGHTEPLSIYTYRVTPNCGPAFVAELRRGR
jgi:hypothetical protein